MSRGDGKVVVVTGANEGIGYHLLKTLREDGYRVAGFDVDVANLRELADRYPDRVQAVECDVTSDEDVQGAVDGVVDEWGQIDVLVNNAAILGFGRFENQTVEDVQRVFDVNYFGYVRTIHAVLPHMRERNRGIVHNVSSGAGRVGNPGLTGYTSTKGAIESFTRSLRLELQDENVHCTIVHPRAANTRSATVLDFPAMSDPEDVGRKLARKIESTRPVVYADWTTRIGLALAQRFPFLVRRSTRKFLEVDETVETPDHGSQATTTGDEAPADEPETANADDAAATGRRSAGGDGS